MLPTLLDTDILSLFMKGEPTVVANTQSYLATHRTLSFSLITYYEILSGLRHRDAKKRLGTFEALAESSTILPVTKTSATISAKLYAQLRGQGKPLDDIDLLIAGTAVANSLRLATRNVKHFGRIEELALQDWSKPL